MSEKAVVYAVVALCVIAGFGLIKNAANARQAGQAAGAAIGNGAAGIVEGLGETMGIPRTSQTQCQQDMAAGRWWDASFSCPAGTFLRGGWNALWS